MYRCAYDEEERLEGESKSGEFAKDRRGRRYHVRSPKERRSWSERGYQVSFAKVPLLFSRELPTCHEPRGCSGWFKWQAGSGSHITNGLRSIKAESIIAYLLRAELVLNRIVWLKALGGCCCAI